MAILIGLALYPVTRAPMVKARAAGTIWRPPSAIVDLEIEQTEAQRRLHQGTEI